jgi:hypothetical protein
MAVKVASAAFVLILLVAHAAGDPGRCLGQPLSLFRDGESGWLGYLLFAALLLVGLLYAAALVRAGEENEAVTAGLAAVLLLLVALTPSADGCHLLCSLLLLAILFGHYWRLLRESGGPWLLPHAVAPFALVLVCGSHSYGLWQKGLILYLVAAANVRHHLLGRRGADRPRGVAAAGRGPGARAVYRLDPGPVWARRKPGRRPAEPGPAADRPRIG